MTASATDLPHASSAADWFDRKRATAYAAILLAFEVAAFLFFVAGTHGWIVPLEQPTTTDFVSFYAAGELANAGTPALVYDQAAHYAAEERATAPGITYEFFYYPPVFIMLCALFAHLPYLAGFVVFEAVTFLLYLLVARRVLPEPGWAGILPFLAYPAVFWTVGLGQNAFLTAALFGAAMLLIDRRPVAAGLLFGAICYKPHLGLLIPLALAAGGRWRAFLAAGAAVSGLVFLSGAIFGWDTWHAFLAAAVGSPATYESGRVDLAGMISPFGAVRVLGGKAALAYAVQAVATVGAIGFVAVIWRRGLSLPIRAAALLAGTLIAVPVVLVYDFMLAALATAWLLRAARETGFLRWEKPAYILAFVIPLVSRSLGVGWHLPLAPLVALLLLAATAVRAWQEIQAKNAAADPLGPWRSGRPTYGAG